MGKLQGKVAIVSGSGRGIGRAVALKLASEGAAVVVNDLDEAPAAETVATITAAGGKAIACIGNVTAPDFGERFVNTALDTFGGLDIIVNNAGYTRDGVIQKQTDEQFQAMLDVHVTAPFRILRAAAEPFRAFAKQEAAEGREVIRKVVNISSMAGTHGNAGQVNYASAKAAVTGMTKMLAKDDPDTLIEIDGRQIQAGVPEQIRGALAAAIPLGRAGTAEEAAGGVYLFCCPESDYVTGEVLIVGGGVSL